MSGAPSAGGLQLFLCSFPSCPCDVSPSTQHTLGACPMVPGHSAGFRSVSVKAARLLCHWGFSSGVPQLRDSSVGRVRSADDPTEDGLRFCPGGAALWCLLPVFLGLPSGRSPRPLLLPTGGLVPWNPSVFVLVVSGPGAESPGSPPHLALQLSHVLSVVARLGGGRVPGVGLSPQCAAPMDRASWRVPLTAGLPATASRAVPPGGSWRDTLAAPSLSASWIHTRPPCTPSPCLPHARSLHFLPLPFVLCPLTLTGDPRPPAGVCRCRSSSCAGDPGSSRGGPRSPPHTRLGLQP